MKWGVEEGGGGRHWDVSQWAISLVILLRSQLAASSQLDLENKRDLINEDTTASI